MTRSLLRACLGCGRQVRGRPRCTDCRRQQEQAKAARRPARKTYSETERRRRVVAEHRATVGDWCPGLGQHPAHPCADLTAHHLVDVGAGGAESGPLVILCRAENSRLAARVLTRMLGHAPVPAERPITHRDGDDPGPVAA
jgi:hypothetical protein